MNKIPIINQIIKDKRKKLKLTQIEFAELINKSKITVARYDTGCIIPQNTLLLTCDKLGLNFMELIIKQKFENKKNNTDYYSELLKKFSELKNISLVSENSLTVLKQKKIKDKLFNIFSAYSNIYKISKIDYFDDKYHLINSNDETLYILTEKQATELIEHIENYIDYFIFKCQKENLNK